MNINEAFQAGHLKLRLEPWAEGEYIELQRVGDSFYGPVAKMHSIFERPDMPNDLRWDGPKDVALWVLPDGDWLPVNPTEAARPGERVR